MEIYSGTSLNQQQVESLLEAINLVKATKRLLDKRVEYIIGQLFPHARSVEGWNWDDNFDVAEGTVGIVAEIYYGGDNDKEWTTFPTCWLYLDDAALQAELVAFAESKKKLEAEERAARERSNAAGAKAARRAQYNALKKEFGE